MREKNRNSIESNSKLPQFTTMNVIDGQAGLVIYSSLIFYSLTIDNILNIIVLLILAGVAIATLTGDNGLLSKATQSKENTIIAQEKEQIALAWNSLVLDKITDTIVKNISENDFALKFQEELNKNGGNISVIFDSENHYELYLFCKKNEVVDVEIVTKQLRK